MPYITNLCSLISNAYHIDATLFLSKNNNRKKVKYKAKTLSLILYQTQRQKPNQYSSVSQKIV